jgi:hypothetical protein
VAGVPSLRGSPLPEGPDSVTDQVVHRWYSRPVLFVADVQRALRFYLDSLGFN